MKAAGFIIALAGLVGTSSLCRAQMSTFPNPPPLAPAPEHAKEPAETAPPRLTLDPGAVDSAKNSATPTPAPAANAPTVTAATLSSMAALDDKVSLEAGDTISFRVIEDRENPVSRIVTDTGEVDFPYIGRVKVATKTCHQVAIEVKKLLEVDYYKHATVIVGLDVIVGQDKSRPRDLAWVVGQVRDVGPLELSKAQATTVSQIILRAGGFGDFADQRKVKVIHRSASNASAEPPDISNIKDGQVVDVKAVFDGKSNVDPVIKAGDYIIVPKKWVNL